MFATCLSFVSLRVCRSDLVFSQAWLILAVYLVDLVASVGLFPFVSAIQGIQYSMQASGCGGPMKTEQAMNKNEEQGLKKKKVDSDPPLVQGDGLRHAGISAI
jgi:hypothetical protein